MAEWLKAADCKSVLIRVRRFESFPAHHKIQEIVFYFLPQKRTKVLKKSKNEF